MDHTSLLNGMVDKKMLKFCQEAYCLRDVNFIFLAEQKHLLKVRKNYFNLQVTSGSIINTK